MMAPAVLTGVGRALGGRTFDELKNVVRICRVIPDDRQLFPNYWVEGTFLSHMYGTASAAVDRVGWRGARATLLRRPNELSRAIFVWSRIFVKSSHFRSFARGNEGSF